MYIYIYIYITLCINTKRNDKQSGDAIKAELLCVCEIGTCLAMHLRDPLLSTHFQQSSAALFQTLSANTSQNPF